MTETSKPQKNPEIEVLRAFIGAALNQGVPGYRADWLLESLHRVEEQVESLQMELRAAELDRRGAVEQLEAEQRQASENFEAMMDERSKAIALQEQLEAAQDALRRIADASVPKTERNYVYAVARAALNPTNAHDRTVASREQLQRSQIERQPNPAKRPES